MLVWFGRVSTPSRSADDSAALVRLRTRLAVSLRPGSTTPTDPGADGTWGDIDYARRERSGWPSRSHMERARDLAVLGRVVSAKAAIAWWLANDPLNPNWWHNQIGIPRLLGEALVVLGDAVPPEWDAGTRRVFARAGEFVLAEDGVTSRPQRWTGANRLWISANRLYAAALFNDAPEAGRSIAAAMEEVRLAEIGEEGIQADGSFHQHGPLLHSGGYGRSFLTDACFFVDVARGTPWAPPAKAVDILVRLLLDGTRWMTRGEDYTPACRDRELSRPHVSCASLASLAEGLAEDCPTRADELRDFAASIRRADAPGALHGNRMFYRSDFMVQQEAEACFAVRMHSTRTVRAECCNAEGLLAHHLADGLTCLTRTGREYHDIFPVWDWQKLPGTTCVQAPHPEPWQLVRGMGASAEVGGVSDGRWGACAQRLATTGHTIRKAWFFGPGAMVCLGTDLHSGHESVVTALDQSLRQGPVEYDGASTPLGDGRHVLTRARWLRHGPWAFVFPQPFDVVVELGARKGAWSRIGAGPATPVTREVFLASVEHGPAPSGGDYAYAVLGDVSDCRSVEKAAAEPGFEILENTAKIQAVWWPGEARLQAVFFGAGDVRFNGGYRLSVSDVCVIQLTRLARGWRLDAAEADQRGTRISAEVFSPDGTKIGQGEAVFPSGVRAGASVTVFCGLG